MKRLFVCSFILFLLTALEVLAKSVEEPAQKSASETLSKKQKWEKLHNLGTMVMVQNTIDDEINGKVGEVISIYSKGDIKIKLEDGNIMTVRSRNILSSLAAPVDYGTAGGITYRPGEEVYYPSQSTSFEIPKGKIDTIFENGKVLIKNGIMYVKELNQLGKEVNCSPQDESICVDDYVMADAYKSNGAFSFEGKVIKAYSNGVVIVQAGNWLHPIDVKSVSKRIAATAADADNSGAVISTREVKESSGVLLKVSPEIEPKNPDFFDAAKERNEEAR